MSASDLLARNPLFSPLPAKERAEIERRLIRRSYTKDEAIFWEGDPAQWLVIVVQGRVKMVKHSDSGRETILTTFGPGQIVGEVGVLIGDAYPASAQAIEPSVTVSLRRAEYIDLVRTHPDLAWALLQELGRRLQNAHETIRSLAVEKVERRVARVLLRLASTAGALACAVPGEVAGLTKALEMYGTRTLAQALAPSIEVARQAGLSPVSEPKISFSRSKLLSR